MQERNERFTGDELKVLKTQDQGFVNYQRNANKKVKLKTSGIYIF